MGQICCFDTNMISYYLIPNSNDPTWPERSKVVENLMNELNSKKAEIFLPSLVLFELLMAYEDPGKRQELFKLLTEMFKIASFDIYSATVGADILSESGYQAKNPSLPGETRKIYKIDSKILATAIALKADVLYTNNARDFKSLANNRIKIIGIEDLPSQGELFTDTTAI